jgi:hypothetical protein
MTAMMRRPTRLFPVLVPVIVLAGCGHPAGNPGRTVFRSLEQTVGVVPPGTSTSGLGH